VELILPKRHELSVPIRNWPENPAPGTLNVRVQQVAFPSKFLEVFGEASFLRLDSKRFSPEAELPWTDIKNNTLPPLPDAPDRGNAQVWRSTLRSVRTGRERHCWVLRRIGSGLWQELELVAGENLRTALDLDDDSPVKVEMEGRWMSAPAQRAGNPSVGKNG
jgi:hypothetical protein